MDNQKGRLLTCAPEQRKTKISPSSLSTLTFKQTSSPKQLRKPSRQSSDLTPTATLQSFSLYNPTKCTLFALFRNHFLDPKYHWREAFIFSSICVHFPPKFDLKAGIPIHEHIWASYICQQCKWKLRKKRCSYAKRLRITHYQISKSFQHLPHCKEKHYKWSVLKCQNMKRFWYARTGWNHGLKIIIIIIIGICAIIIYYAIFM